MKIKLIFIFWICAVILMSRSACGQNAVGYTRQEMMLKGVVKTMQYDKYYGQFEQGVFVKEEKKTDQRLEWKGEPSMRAVFDMEGHVVSEKDYNGYDQNSRKISYRYNLDRLIYKEKTTVFNETEICGFIYDKNNRLTEHRCYAPRWRNIEQPDLPEKSFFDANEQVSGAVYQYDDNGHLIAVNNIFKCSGTDVFLYDTLGYISEINCLQAQWINAKFNGGFSKYWKKKIFQYDGVGRLNQVITFDYNSVVPVLSVVYSYTSDGFLCEKIIYNIDQYRDKSQQQVYACEYNNKGQIIAEHKTYSKNEKCTFTYEYNEQGDIITATEHRASFGIKGMPVFYEYEYDAYGNWITRYEFRGKECECHYVEERTFEYY